MSKRKVFENSVIPLPAQTGQKVKGLMVNAKSAENNAAPMPLLFSFALEPDKSAELEARVAQGQVISPEDLQQKYSVQPADQAALVKWLKDEGFQVTDVSADGTSVYATGTVAQIERSLKVHMVRVTKEGLTYNAARDAPSLPMQVGKNVHAILGLQPYRKAIKHFRRSTPRRGNRVALGATSGSPTPAPNIQNAPPYLVAEILKAYNADGLGVSGKGQTIAILIDTFPSDADLQAFWQQNNLAVTLAQIEKVNVGGGILPPVEGEETLDVSWASGIAPGAQVRIYASGSLSFVALDQALDKIIADLATHPGLCQLSISLGLGEKFMSPGEVAIQHQKFLKLAAAGVNVFVSSGDAGSNPDDSGHSPTGPLQAEYESSDTSVIGVGGTRLTLAANGSVSSETGWVFGGGGKSIFFKRPIWQQGPGVPTGKKRLVPDVSLAADPNRGAFLILNGQVNQIGGTSWSAPVWAGFCALLNEARTKAGKPPLPFLNPKLYPLIGTAAFRDILSGSNGAFTAGPGYDLVTGIGVPNVGRLSVSLQNA
jgi:kumamolisin